MKTRRQMWTGIAAAIGLLLLILDTKTAIDGATEGLALSLRSVIPSLFPFLILSFMINKAFSGMQISILAPLGKLCNIPAGAESILLLGFLGGYPVGAECVKNAYISGNITRSDAHRMLGFCSNAGPAFIFGMCSTLFSSAKTLWIMWAIHIISAIVVGCILPRNTRRSCILPANTTVSITAAIQQSVRTIGNICAWVIVFRIIIKFILRWFLWVFPPTVQIAVTGILELTNGCSSLYSMPLEAARFVLCSVFLSFGGLCVAMQTVSVTKDLGTGMYFPGKILQCIFSFLLAVLLLYTFNFTSEAIHISVAVPIIFSILAVIIIISLHKSKKVVAITC